VNRVIGQAHGGFGFRESSRGEIRRRSLGFGDLLQCLGMKSPLQIEVGIQGLPDALKQLWRNQLESFRKCEVFMKIPVRIWSATGKHYYTATYR